MPNDSPLINLSFYLRGPSESWWWSTSASPISAKWSVRSNHRWRRAASRNRIWARSQGLNERYVLIRLTHQTESVWRKDTGGRRPRRWSNVSPTCCRSGCTSSWRSCHGLCSPPTRSPGRIPYSTHGSGGLQDKNENQHISTKQANDIRFQFNSKNTL